MNDSHLIAEPAIIDSSSLAKFFKGAPAPNGMTPEQWQAYQLGLNEAMALAMQEQHRTAGITKAVLDALTYIAVAFVVADYSTHLLNVLNQSKDRPWTVYAVAGAGLFLAILIVPSAAYVAVDAIDKELHVGESKLSKKGLRFYVWGVTVGVMLAMFALLRFIFKG